jgi:hypothetical protein
MPAMVLPPTAARDQVADRSFAQRMGPGTLADRPRVGWAMGEALLDLGMARARVASSD